MMNSTKQEELIKQGIFDYNINTGAAGMTEKKGMDEVVRYFSALINQEVTSVLEELEKKSTHYTSDGLVADGLDPWATSVSAIQTIKERYNA